MKKQSIIVTTLLLATILIVVFVFLNSSDNKENRKDDNAISFREDIYEPFSGVFKVENNNVYFGDYLLSSADSDSFKVIDHNYDDHYYAKDNENVYFKNRLIKNTDPKTFKIVEPRNSRGFDSVRYAKDKNNVYWNGFILQDADPDSFIFNTDLGLWEDINCYYKDNSLIDRFCDKKVNTIGGKTVFDILNFDTGYDGYRRSSSYLELKNIKNISYKYGIDTMNKNIYELYTGRIIPDLDPEATRLVVKDKIYNEYSPIVYDNEDIYWADNSKDQLAPELIKMNFIDPETFTVLPTYGAYSYDKNYIYFKGVPIQPAN